MKRLISIIVVLAAFSFLIWNLQKNWQEISSISWNIKGGEISLLLISLFLMCAANIVSWHVVMRVLGANLSFWTNTRIWVLSNFSRWIPGTIWQYVSRVYLLSDHGISKKIGITAIVVETLFNLSATATIVLITLPFWHLPPGVKNLQNMLWVVSLLPLLIFTLLNPKILRLVMLLVKRARGGKNISFRPIQMTLGIFFLLIVTFIGRFLPAGLVLFYLIRLVSPMSYENLPSVLGIFSLSWLIGYITIFAPGGLGAMEISLSALLSLYIPLYVATVSAIAVRIILLFGEVLSVILVLLWTRKKIGKD